MSQRFPGRIASLFGSLSNFGRTSVVDFLHDRPATLQGKNRGYQKFVLLGHQRSGSSMAISALAKHPQMIVFNELFVPDRIFFDTEGFDNRSAKLLAFRDARPVEFLNEFIFGPYRDDVKAVGFKLFPDQIDRRRFRRVWKWLSRSHDLKIIYLTRRDLLATYASLLVAQKDKRFSIKNQSERTRTTVCVDPETCLAEFHKRRLYEEAIERNIHEHQVLRWHYEELAAAPEERLNDAQQFLGVDVRDLKTSMVKQEVRPMSEVIENYGELRQYFAATPWAYLFREQPFDSEQARERSTIAGLPQAASTVVEPSAKRVSQSPFHKVFLKRPALTGLAIAASLLFLGLFLLQAFATNSVAREQTVFAIGQLATRIKTYVRQHHELPPQLSALGLQTGVAQPAIDAWSHPLDYFIVDPNTFMLTSYGSDGVPGGNGDGSDIVRTFRLVNGEIRGVQ